ncbi:hypothetical protein IAT38_000018 [Cryptococcus sp. DSM 104549]
MARSKKRQARVSEPDPAPRVEVVHDWKKDDQELDLEEALFGRVKKRAKAVKDVQEDEESGMSDVEDTDLFTVDAPLAPQFQLDLDGELDGLAGGEEDESDDESASGSASGSGSRSGSSDDDSDDENEFRAFSQSPAPADLSAPTADPSSLEEDTGPNRPTITLPDDIIDLAEVERQRRKEKAKKALWHDPADDLVGVDMSENRRLRKIDRGKRKAVEGEMIGGVELQSRLREQFERLHPAPEWAKNRTAIGTPSLNSLLSTTASFIAPVGVPGKHRGALPTGTLDLKRMKDANQASPTVGKRDAPSGAGGVVDFAWHPAKTVGVIAVAGGDRRVRFFNIDGHTNPTLMTLHIPSLPLSRTTFHPSGTSLFLSGNRPFYYTYDLASQRCLRSPRNLFGSSNTPSTPNSLHRHSFSPDGSLLAVAGRRGAVSILEWNGGGAGAGAVVAEFRSGRGGSVEDFTWGKEGRELSVLGGRDGAEVEVWDVRERRIVRKWRDDRALGGLIMQSSADGAYTAVGSNTGIVNLYSSSSLTSGPSSSSSGFVELAPEPIKSLEHLTMPISTMAFHPSSEVLVTASTGRKDLLKIYHLPTATAFSNWPTPNTPLGRVTKTGFSSNGEYLTVGNQRGAVLLWSLRHFS